MKINTRQIRTDGKEKIRGENKYLEDLYFEDLYFARTLRSEISRGIIKEIIYPTIPDGYYIIDENDVLINEVKMIDVDMPVFAKKRVNYIGEPISLIVGKDKDVIINILNNTKVIYEKFPSVYSMEEAKANNVQIIDKENNEFVSHEFSTGDVKSLIDCEIFEDIYETTYQEQLYMEKQGVVGDYKDGELIIYGSMQCPYYVKNALMHSTGFDEATTRVIQTDTGGAFGGKEEYPSLLACQIAAATLKIKKPVRLVFDRREDIMYTTKRHPSKIYIKSYVKNKKIVGLVIDVALDAGPYIGLSDVVLQRALFTLNGAYQVENVNVKGIVYATNNVFTGAFRGFGAPQTMFAIEQHFNQVAKKLNIDPFDFKRAHFVNQGEKTVTNGLYVEDIKLKEIADKLEKLSNYKEKMEKEDSNDSYYGIGVSFVPHGGGFTGDGEAEHIKAKIKLRKNKDNTVDILIANVEMGQGAKTALSKIVASVINIDIEDVSYNNPDTKYVPDSGPTVASRTTMIVGRLLYRAAIKVKERFNEEEFIIEENFKAPDYLIWNADTFQGNAYMSYSWSGVVAEVEVDKITYDITVTKLYGVYDIGYPIDIKLVEGQIHGGMIQGMGMGMMENMTSKNGIIEQNNFEAYSVPTIKDIPKMEFDLVINEFDDGPFGAKGVGELTLVGIPPAIASAIENAVGKNFYKVPVTPEYILEVKENA
jgi:CO/xanthine dehydrogenase Mo-binding subunit